MKDRLTEKYYVKEGERGLFFYKGGGANNDEMGGGSAARETQTLSKKRRKRVDLSLKRGKTFHIYEKGGKKNSQFY